MESETTHAWEIEEFLQDHDVFVNAINGKPAHSDSYMTVVDYNKLNSVLQSNPFNLESWKVSINYWLTNENMQPPLILVAKAAQRYFKLV